MSPASDQDPKHKNIAIIGLGHRGFKAFRVLKDHTLFNLIAICDPSDDAARRSRAIRPDVPWFPSTDQLIACFHGLCGDSALHCAYVAIPHSQYPTTIPPLLRAGIHILKEKPAGANSDELRLFRALASAHHVRLVTAAQHRFGSHWIVVSDWMQRLGSIHVVEGTRRISIYKLDEGWRSRNHLAAGGALNDIGWHLVDDVLLASPSSCTRRCSEHRAHWTTTARIQHILHAS